MDIPAIAAGLVLAGVHVVTPGLRFLKGVPRSTWLSVAGGVSVAYVFVHLLPGLAEGQRQLEEAVPAPAALAERSVYLVALAGLAVFHGLERLAKVSRARARGGDRSVDPEAATSAGVFWIHMASFTVYNALVGYLLLHQEAGTGAGLLLFVVAMALHFVVTDFGMEEHHQHRYRRVGRWIMAAAVVAGVAAGAAVAVHEAAVAALGAFLAGGVILNILKEEVPTERESRFWAFATGIVTYSALLVAA
ncbi:MAG TPA: hypothetical protein VFQ45_06730 [Longimicrobium sp.]|nr:hypothetical protein [Longimicrobium sp.]